MQNEDLVYLSGKQKCFSYLSYDPSIKEPRPCVLVAPTFEGLNQFTKDKADEIASLGYIALALDLYGERQVAHSEEEAFSLMLPLFVEREILLERILSGFNAAQKLPQVNLQKIGAIGFCFGGLAVIELARSGTDFQGGVSFHPTLAHSLKGENAKLLKAAPVIKSPLLILLGAKDPMATFQDQQNLTEELISLKSDWQMYLYGQAGHSFTDPKVNSPKNGKFFEPQTNRRSFISMTQFFIERFQ